MSDLWGWSPFMALGASIKPAEELWEAQYIGKNSPSTAPAAVML